MNEPKDLTGRLVWSEKYGYGIVLGEREGDWDILFQRETGYSNTLVHDGGRVPRVHHYLPTEMTILPNPGEEIEVKDNSSTSWQRERYVSFLPGRPFPYQTGWFPYTQFRFIPEEPTLEIRITLNGKELDPGVLSAETRRRLLEEGTEK